MSRRRCGRPGLKVLICGVVTVLFAAACTSAPPQRSPVTAPGSATGHVAMGPSADEASAVPTGPTALATGPAARCYAGMADAPGDGGVLLYGGFDNSGPPGAYLPDLWGFEPDGGWTQVSEAMEVEPGEAVLHTPTGRVVTRAAGGTWGFDPTTSTWEDLRAESPPGYAAAMAYDSESDRLVLFGGYGPGDVPTDETWAFDFETRAWILMQARRSPPARVFHAMAYDESLDRVVLFGGATTVDDLGDTWTYDLDSDTWRRVPVEGGPEPRLYSAMAYDRRTDRIVLFGGAHGAFLEEEVFDDTWAFDLESSTWTRLEAEGPSARGWHVMTADAGTGTVVLFGGGPSREACTDETWVFDPREGTWGRVG